MTKRELEKRTDENFNATTEALQTVYNELNNGQRKKLLKVEKIKILFERYGVKT